MKQYLLHYKGYEFPLCIISESALRQEIPLTSNWDTILKDAEKVWVEFKMVNLDIEVTEEEQELLMTGDAEATKTLREELEDYSSIARITLVKKVGVEFPSTVISLTHG